MAEDGEREAGLVGLGVPLLYPRSSHRNVEFLVAGTAGGGGRDRIDEARRPDDDPSTYPLPPREALPNGGFRLLLF